MEDNRLNAENAKLVKDKRKIEKITTRVLKENGNEF
jgi:hypothetical protein